MITLIMRVRIKADQVDVFTGLVTQLATDVYANEPDCLAFEVRQSQEDPTLFVFYECFRNQEAHSAHPDMPYHKAMSEAGWDCVDGEPQIEYLTPLAGAPAAFRGA
ncbi:putative quinol monooxygenase [Luminiphilus syltensis]|nr:putative quinol monooxygenase [Luminiphilus syltensis]